MSKTARQTQPLFDLELGDLESTMQVVAYDETTRLMTLTLDPSVLRQLLTCASLHLYANKPNIKVIDPNDPIADVIQANNRENENYEWQLRDTIMFLEGIMSDAVNPSRNDGRSKKQDLRGEREHRMYHDEKVSRDAEWERQTATKREAAGQPVHGFTSYARQLGVQPVQETTQNEIETRLMEDGHKGSIEWADAVSVMLALRKTQEKNAAAEERIVTARKALGASY